MTTTAKPASNGSTATAATQADPGDGLVKLRREETKNLISLVSEAISQTFNVTHEMHRLIYSSDEFSPDYLDWMSEEALACWQTADHYLRMLRDVLADYDPHSGSDLARLLRGTDAARPF